MGVKKHQWVVLSEDDHHTTTAMQTGYGALVKNQSFEMGREDGMRITKQIGESMSYVPNVRVEQVKGVWVLEPHYPGALGTTKAPNL
ncbi:hypothetical protein D3C71_364840 [compost metagenome]